MNISMILHEYRVFPRVILLGYSGLLYYVTEWFMSLPDPTTQQTVLMTTIAGLSAAVFGFYTTTTSGTNKK